MWELAATQLAKVAIEKYFEGKSRKDSDLVSIGVAVGYFANFIQPIAENLKVAGLTLVDLPDGKESWSKQFHADDVELKIIMPRELSARAFDSCEKKFKSYKKGSVYLAAQGRSYGINYSVNEKADRQELVIADLAKPIMSVKMFYENVVRLDTSIEEDPRWRKIQRAEITAFKECLERLQRRGYGTLINKIQFDDIS